MQPVRILGVIEKATGDFLGWFHLRPNKENPAETELGYRLKKAVWGRGFATEGAIALIEKGFLKLRGAKVVAYTMAVNTRSQRVMEKAGLRFEREFVYLEDPLPGWRADDCLEVKYGPAKEQWESIASSVSVRAINAHPFVHQNSAGNGQV